MTKEIIKQIFQEIDEAMQKTTSKVPVLIEDSKFLQEYLKIKMRYLSE